MNFSRTCLAVFAIAFSGCGDEGDGSLPIVPSGTPSPVEASVPAQSENGNPATMTTMPAIPSSGESVVDATAEAPAAPEQNPETPITVPAGTAGSTPMAANCPEGQSAVDGVCVAIEDQTRGLPNSVIEQLVGTYAIRTKIAVIQQVPILGEMENMSTVYGFTEIYADGRGGLLKTQRGCGARSETGDAVEVIIPEAIPQSVEAPVTPLTVWEEDGVINWELPEIVMAIGIRLQDPVNEPLPMDANDPRIWDQDQDGQPGVTVNVSGFASGDIYVIQKQVSSEYGVLDDNGHLSGYIIDNSEQFVIGATNFLLNQQIPSRPHPDSELSTVLAVPVDGMNDCSWLLANEAQLFPSNP